MPKRAAKQYAIFTAKVDLQQNSEQYLLQMWICSKTRKVQLHFCGETVCNYENELAATALLQ